MDEARTSRGLSARWHAWPLYQRILGAMVLGAATGVLLGQRAHNLEIPATLVLRLLGALAPGLILLAIMQALMRAQLERGTAGRLFRLLALNTLVAIAIGLLVANVLRPGAWSRLSPVSNPTPSAAHPPKPDFWHQLLDNIPQSLLGPLTDQGKVLAVIVLALAFGAALRRFAKRPVASVQDLVDVGLDALVVLLHYIIDWVPLAVFGLVASIVGVQGFAPFRALGAFIASVLLALLLQASYYLARIWLGSWVSPRALLRGCSDALLMAFSTGSSTVTMPVTFESLKTRVGLRERSASLGALVGSNFNNDGTALYEAMAALFVSQLLAAQGHAAPLGLSDQLLLVATSVAASVGAAGIPEAGLVTMTLVFHAVNLPSEYIALLLPVDWFLDRCRTMINVMGDMNVSCMLDGKRRDSDG